MDDLLVDLKLPPETLEVSIPTYFVEERAEQHSRRDRLIEGYSNLKLGVAKLPLEADPFASGGAADMEFSLEEAIEIIQRNERGRQGRQRAILVQELREEEKQRRLYEAKEQEEALATKRQKTAQMLADAQAADEQAFASELEARDKRRRLAAQLEQQA